MVLLAQSRRPVTRALVALGMKVQLVVVTSTRVQRHRARIQRRVWTRVAQLHQPTPALAVQVFLARIVPQT